MERVKADKNATMIISNVNGFISHCDTRGKLGHIVHVFAEEARNKVPIVLSRGHEPMYPRAEVIAYPSGFMACVV